MDWTSFWLGVAAVPAVLFVIGAVAAAFIFLFGPARARHECAVCAYRKAYDFGEYTRLGAWLRTRRHDWVIASEPWHLERWSHCRWNAYRDEGIADGPGETGVTRARRHGLKRVWHIIFP